MILSLTSLNSVNGSIKESPVYINSDYISMMYSDCDGTTVGLRGQFKGLSEIIVKESPDDIMHQINK